MNLHLNGDYVLVEDASREKDSGKFLVSVEDSSNKGLIVGIGPDVPRFYEEAEVTVYFDRHFSPLIYEGKTFKIMKLENIFAYTT